MLGEPTKVERTWARGDWASPVGYCYVYDRSEGTLLVYVDDKKVVTGAGWMEDQANSITGGQ